MKDDPRAATRWPLGAIAGAVLAAMYLLTLLRWFRYRTVGLNDLLPFREHSTWPLALATLTLATALAWHSRRRLGRLAREAKAALSFDRTDAAILLGLLVFATAWQAPFVAAWAGVLESDMSLPGLAAKHIYDGRVAHAFMYGKQYLGSLSSHLIAASYVVTGPTAATLVIETRILFLAFLVAQYGLLRLGFGRLVAGATVLWLSATPAFLLQHLHAEFAETLAFAAAALAVFAARVTDRLHDDMWYAIAGALLGLAFWGHQIIAAIAGGVVLTLFLLRDRSHALAAMRPTAAGFLLGALPALVGWGAGVADFAQFLSGETGAEPRTLGGVLEKIFALFREQLPTVGGVIGRLQVASWPITLAAVALTVPSIVWGLAHLRRDRREAPAPASAVASLLAVVVLCHMGAYAVAGFGTSDRHQVPLYLALIGLIVAASTALLTRFRLRQPAIVALILAAVVGWSALGSALTLRYLRAVRADHATLLTSIEILEEADVTRCRAEYWIAYRMNFVSLERILCSPTDHEREGYYQALVDEAFPDSPAPIVANRRPRREAREFRNALRRQRFEVSLLETPAFTVVIPERRR